MINRESLPQFIKYVCVGAFNTVVTLFVIFVCKSLFGMLPMVSNTIGYVCGLVNSFLWNKKWVFRSGGRYVSEAMRFVLGFVICYIVQFVVVWWLSYHTQLGSMMWLILGFSLSGYGVATVIGNMVYTAINFVYNRFVSFRDDNR